MPFRTLALTASALVFFAANSILARLALRGAEIDAASFTVVRVLSGTVALAILAALRERTVRSVAVHGSLRAGVALFAYAIAFSFAYLSLDAGTGALLLFAAVQITMLGSGIVSGDHPRAAEWLGLLLASVGLVYLVLPGLTAPPLPGVALMLTAGAAWGTYSLAAKRFNNPVAATAGNFLRATPLAAAAFLAYWTVANPQATPTGIVLAATSGAITSGLGYAIWYMALKDLRTSRAAIVQLTVPVLAATAGVVFLGEDLTLRLTLAATTILGGVALALTARSGASMQSRSPKEDARRVLG